MIVVGFLTVSPILQKKKFRMARGGNEDLCSEVYI
jgi:hypothetical protein